MDIYSFIFWLQDIALEFKYKCNFEVYLSKVVLQSVFQKSVFYRSVSGYRIFKLCKFILCHCTKFENTIPPKQQ